MSLPFLFVFTTFCLKIEKWKFHSAKVDPNYFLVKRTVLKICFHLLLLILSSLKSVMQMRLGGIPNKLGSTHLPFKGCPTSLLNQFSWFFRLHIHWSMAVCNFYLHSEIMSLQLRLRKTNTKQLVYSKGIVLDAQPLWGRTLNLGFKVQKKQHNVDGQRSKVILG